MSFSRTNSPLGFGRGRGLQFSPVPFTLGGGGNVVVNDNVTPHISPAADINQPQCSTAQESAFENVGLVNQMSDIVQQIGQQLADSIVTRLNTSPNISVPKGHQSTPDECEPVYNRTLDLSQVAFVRTGAKEPPAFKGEGSDSVSIDEWEESMRHFICKNSVPLESQAEEIIVHLRGRAKDIVKFGIRNGEVDVKSNPNAIYSLLRKHFSPSVCSSVPLADFYSTLPKENEDPYEFWLRLNRAADNAVSCLSEQGKEFDNPSVEVTRMFIRHCPSKDLALTFRSKTIDKWTAREVQEVLDEYHLERGPKCSSVNNRVMMNKVELSPNVPHATNVSDNSTLERLISMLEKVLLQNQTTLASRKPRGDQRSPKVKGFTSAPCLVCNNVSHSALTHCRDNNLCFLCHLPGHARRDCPQNKQTSHTDQQGN
ncbi:unnamed protein product [Knipowitschia caucasica]